MPTTSPFALPEYRALLAARLCDALAGQALNITIGYTLYEITHDPLAIGGLGLIEAIPALSISLFGGHVADKADRRAILLLARVVGMVCALLLALAVSGKSILPIYAVILVWSGMRGFAGPAGGALEAQILPREMYAQTAGLGGGIWLVSGIAGAALAGFALKSIGASGVCLVVAALIFLSFLCLLRITPRPIPPREVRDAPDENIWQSLREGVRFVFRNQYLVGSMALDLFAVLFGGAVALLPIFAEEILHVGKVGFGYLNAAPLVGSAMVMLLTTRFPVRKNAGKWLLVSVAGFGISILVFALSKTFWISLAALVFTGIFDGISMVVRITILRLFAPEHMRGRVEAVSNIFVGASNEIGAFESGVAARLLGTAPSVLYGGIVTLLTVVLTALFAPKLRHLDFTQHEER